jgi:hypothetical protein
MKKRLLCIVCVVALLLSALPGVVFAAERVVRVYLDGELMVFDVEPRIIDNRTLVPLRFIAESLGALVTWDDTTRTARLEKDGDVIDITVGDKTMLVNGVAIALDVPPKLVDNRTLVPLRAIAESFHIAVDWDERDYAVIITSKPLFGVYETKEFSLLNDRLRVTLPDFSRDEAMQNGIMSPESSSDEVTRIFIEKDGEKLVLYVAELFLQAGEDLSSDARTIFLDEYGREGTLGAPVTSVGVSYISLTPDAYTGRDGITLREALIKTRDGLLVYAAVLASPETFAKKYECVKTAESILAAITAGGRTIDRSQRVDTSMYGFKLTLQSDYVLTNQRGIDFDVYYIQKVVKPGERQPYMGIYTGNHPSYSEGEGATLLPGRMLERDIVWRCYNEKVGEIAADTRIETLITYSAHEYPMYLHIFAYPATPEAWTELRQMAESMTAA